MLAPISFERLLPIRERRCDETQPFRVTLADDVVSNVTSDGLTSSSHEPQRNSGMLTQPQLLCTR